MSKKNKKHERGEQGIVALFPAIIISSVLIILSVGASRSFLSFLYRTTILDQKVQSDLTAHACTLRVLTKHIQGNDYRGGETILVGDSSCVVGLFSATTSFVTVKIGEAVSTKNIAF